ncbi:hypothetical protein [Pseudanabaena yagii]|uniref:Uncharacterized protein n=1 Tax=Pseudanabaena yagii GIHE-NHR1 TaxID=2722753 RepID=A0ABX1LVK9_9CYAN|nr:hypothetical protein [Pseudanabaena yagii]NMF59401.1 hypothetical protein [Pseudanabaena yagii GIHE-NHR1]
MLLFKEIDTTLGQTSLHRQSSFSMIAEGDRFNNLSPKGDRCYYES